MTELTRDERPTLVVGGTGKTGRRVVDRLGARGLPVPIRAGDVLGNTGYVTDGVQRALGRPPRDFTDYATRTAATGTWTQLADR